MEPGQVFGRNATSKGFFRIAKKLDKWLNGDLFPLPARGKNAPRASHIQLTASTFAGDDPVSGQMHLDFKAYDFKYIPTETLSVVYQQFLHAEGRGRHQGAYYTPVHLANFILDELDAKLPLQKGMSVFDPSCGSGAFLVQCYRLLIERELASGSEKHIRASELRDILIRHIYGIDVDEDACGITELSLILTLLDYVDPPDLEKAYYKRFRLPILRNQNIFCCEKGFFDPDSEFEENRPKSGFDWIVGNPPWKKLSQKSNDVADKAALKWIANHQKQFPVSDNQLAEAFAWRVTQYISNQGLVGLLMPAATLFKTKGTKRKSSFRKAFFSHTHVWCVVNFSNLRHLLFEGAVKPAAAFFYSLGYGNESSSRIISYAPFAVNQPVRSADKQGKTKLWTVTVDASEIREVSQKDVVSGSGLPWKIAMWGSYRDRHLLNSLTKEFMLLSEFARNHNLHIHEGPQLRTQNTEESVEYVPEVIGKPRLDMNSLRGCGRIFSFPAKTLKIVEAEQAYVRKGRRVKPLTVCFPPHLIIDAARRFAVFSEKFIVVPPRQIGIAGRPSQTNLLKALALYLNSDFVRYHQFMTSTSWGIERDLTDKDVLEDLPIPIDLLSEKELKNWSKLHDNIVKQEQNQSSIKKESRFDALLTDLNGAVYDLLKLDKAEKWLVEDLLFVRMKLNEGKLPREAVRSANQSEIREYAEVLKTGLDGFLDNEIRDQHKVSVYYSNQLAMVRIDHPEIPPAGPVTVSKVKDSEIEKEFSGLRKNLSHIQGQWIYFERNLKYYEGKTTYFFKPIQRLNWLKTQALLDADELIAEKLS